jgi:hypothetical protein
MTFSGILMSRGRLAGRRYRRAYSNTRPQLVNMTIDVHRFNLLAARIDLDNLDE